MRPLLCALLLVATIAPARPAAAASCVMDIGPGIPPPPAAPAKLPGFHATWYGQSGYMRLCPGDMATATLAYYNSGSLGWVAGRLGEVAYLGTWESEPGQDQPSILGGDGQLRSPATAWPRYNRVAQQPAPYVGPGQVAWFQFTVQAPANPGTYRLYVRPLIEGATWLEDIGVFWQVLVLNADGTLPKPTPPDPRGTSFHIDAGVTAPDIALVHQGVQHASAHLDAFAGGARRTPSIVHVYVGDGTERYCCLTIGDSFEIVTSNRAWATPQAAAPDTWSADTERTELAAHEYIHLWQYDVGGNPCMVGVRWISEGMAESFAYRSLVRVPVDRRPWRHPARESRRLHEAAAAHRDAAGHAAVARGLVAGRGEPVRGLVPRGRPPARDQGSSRDPRLVRACRRGPGLAAGFRGGVRRIHRQLLLPVRSLPRGLRPIAVAVALRRTVVVPFFSCSSNPATRPRTSA